MNNSLKIYEMSVNVRAGWLAHSLSNFGNDGSIRIMPRKQVLADGTESDACSGNILKHHHSVLLAEYLEFLHVPMCPACAARDPRRASGLIDRANAYPLTINNILSQCGLCDTHGFLIPGKNAAADGSTVKRQRVSKHSLVEFSFALALPGIHAETLHTFTRTGDSKEDGQMILKRSGRSGEYAFCVRYRAAGVGLDTDKWTLVLQSEEERTLRHRAVLSALRDQVLSPEGALTSTMLPHLVSLIGAIVVRTEIGRAPVMSALSDKFIERLELMASDNCLVFPFGSVDEFHSIMNTLIETSSPTLPQFSHVQEAPGKAGSADSGENQPKGKKWQPKKKR